MSNVSSQERTKLCFGDKVVLSVRSSSQAVQDGNHDTEPIQETTSIGDLQSPVVYGVPGEEDNTIRLDSLVLQVLTVKKFEAQRKFLELQEDHENSLSEKDPLLHLAKIEARLEEMDNIAEQERKNGSDIYYGDKIQLQDVETKMNVVINKRESTQHNVQCDLEVCLKKENGPECIFEMVSGNDSLTFLDEVCYEQEVLFLSASTDDKGGGFLVKFYGAAKPTAARDGDLSDNDSLSGHSEVENEADVSKSEFNSSSPTASLLPANSSSLPRDVSSVAMPADESRTYSITAAATSTAQSLLEEAREFVEQLLRHVNPKLKTKRPRKKYYKNLWPIPTLLVSLQLKLSDGEWVSNFVHPLNNGHIALCELIKDLADYPVIVSKKKKLILKRDMVDLESALICLCLLVSNKEGLSVVCSCNFSLRVLVHCLYCPQVNSNAATHILDMLCLVMSVSAGDHRKVMEIFDELRVEKKTRTKFDAIVASLRNEAAAWSYKIAVMRFINGIIETAHEPNKRVLYQHEIVEAGFDPKELEKFMEEEDTNELHDQLLLELNKWRSNFINIHQFIEEREMFRRRADETSAMLEQAERQLDDFQSHQETLRQHVAELTEKMDFESFKNEVFHLRNRSIEDKLKETQRNLQETKYHLQFTREELDQTKSKSDVREGLTDDTFVAERTLLPTSGHVGSLSTSSLTTKSPCYSSTSLSRPNSSSSVLEEQKSASKGSLFTLGGNDSLSQDFAEILASYTSQTAHVSSTQQTPELKTVSSQSIETQTDSSTTHLIDSDLNISCSGQNAPVDGQSQVMGLTSLKSVPTTSSVEIQTLSDAQTSPMASHGVRPLKIDAAAPTQIIPTSSSTVSLPNPQASPQLVTHSTETQTAPSLFEVVNSSSQIAMSENDFGPMASSPNHQDIPSSPLSTHYHQMTPTLSTPSLSLASPKATPSHKMMATLQTKTISEPSLTMKDKSMAPAAPSPSTPPNSPLLDTPGDTDEVCFPLPQVTVTEDEDTLFIKSASENTIKNKDSETTLTHQALENRWNSFTSLEQQRNHSQLKSTVELRRSSSSTILPLRRSRRIYSQPELNISVDDLGLVMEQIAVIDAYIKGVSHVVDILSLFSAA